MVPAAVALTVVVFIVIGQVFVALVGQIVVAHMLLALVIITLAIAAIILTLGADAVVSLIAVMGHCPGRRPGCCCQPTT